MVGIPFMSSIFMGGVVFRAFARLVKDGLAVALCFFVAEALADACTAGVRVMTAESP